MGRWRCVALCALLVAASTTLGCGEACSHDEDCEQDEYCSAASGDDGDCLERKKEGEACKETHECDHGLVCSSQKCAEPPCSPGQCPKPLIDWGSACSTHPVPSGTSRWTIVAIVLGAALPLAR